MSSIIYMYILSQLKHRFYLRITFYSFLLPVDNINEYILYYIIFIYQFTHIYHLYKRKSALDIHAILYVN